MMNAMPVQLIPVGVRRRATAIHEAGHAVAAIIKRRDVTKAVLYPPEGLTGETLFGATPKVRLKLKKEHDRIIVENAIIVALAGQVAEAYFWSKMPFYGFVPTSHRNDDVEIRKLKAGFKFSAEQDEDFLNHCKSQTRIIILERRAQDAISDIADKLCVDRIISRSELNDVLRRHLLI